MNHDTPLKDVLKMLGYFYKKAPKMKHSSPYRQDIIDNSGNVVFTGDAYHVWAWLRESKQIDF